MNIRRHKAAVLVGLMAVASIPAGRPAAAEPDAGAPIAIELNKLESNGDACRAYLLLKNTSAWAFDSLKLDLVMFDIDGVVTKRLAVQAAPLPQGKTSLKVFDVAGHACGGIGSILLNDVLACAPATAGECLELITASARGGVPFIK